MKHYFKYASGYINIDDENLYMTNSGNWQETHGLHEKSTATIKQNRMRVINMKAFVYSFFGGVLSFALFMISYKVVSVVLMLVMGAGAYYLFEYFKHDFGNRYKIPLSKIEGIEEYQDGLKLRFRNATGDPDVEIVPGVTAETIGIMTNLGLISAKEGQQPATGN